MSAGLLASTVTPGSTPPVASRATPAIAPVDEDCAATTRGIAASTRIPRDHFRHFIVLPFPSRRRTRESDKGRCLEDFFQRSSGVAKFVDGHPHPVEQRNQQV